MARGSSKGRERRVTAVNASRSVHLPYRGYLVDIGTGEIVGTEPTEDHRFWSPVPSPLARPLYYSNTVVQHRLRAEPWVDKQQRAWRNLKALQSTQARRNRPRQAIPTLPSRVYFDNPLNLRYCLRRSIRRRVFHALGLSGRRGRGAYRKPRYSWYSKIGC